MVPKGRNLKHQIDFVFCRFQPKEENSTEKEEILHFDPNSIIEQKHSSISATSHTTLLVQKNNLLVCWGEHWNWAFRITLPWTARKKCYRSEEKQLHFEPKAEV